jgi:hypothetical protein
VPIGKPLPGRGSVVPSAGEVEWQALRVIVYPWTGGVYLAVERRDGRGSSHRDVRVIGGPLELERTFDANAELPELLRTIAEALARAADRSERIAGGTTQQSRA